MPLIPKQEPPYYQNSNGTTIKEYIAKISQVGTAAPTAIILKNTYEGTEIWARSGVGEYTFTLTGELTYNNTTIEWGSNESIAWIQSAEQASPDSLYFSTTLVDSTTLADGLLRQATITITTYP